ncbi:MAG: hypothetical protein Q7T96_03390 [Methylobacter sp.]|nr:hypothetical protein [Methylobacter sp.]
MALAEQLFILVIRTGFSGGKVERHSYDVAVPDGRNSLRGLKTFSGLAMVTDKLIFNDKDSCTFMLDQ